MKTVKLFLLMVLFTGIAALNSDVVAKGKPTAGFIGTTTFTYSSSVYEFIGTASLYTVNTNIQIKGEGYVDETLTYKIGGYVAPVGGGVYTGPVTVEIRNGICCVEKATGTATLKKDGDNYVLEISGLTFKTPVCPKLK